MTLPTIHHGDCLEVLRTFPDNSFDGLLSDPPAGIGFMGKAWDRDKGGRDQWIAWLASVMREAHRVLKPGAFGLVWALPRTAHWTTMALEDAGFEVRDVVLHLFGSGFPKSLDISKAIDSAAGKVREVREVRVGPRPGTHGGGGVYGHGDDRSITSPATDLARDWSGYGTAMKPSHERWVLVRKPHDVDVAIQRVSECLSKLHAAIVANRSESNQSGRIPQSFAPCDAASPPRTPDASFDPTATSPFASETVSSLNIVLSWQDILDALSQHTNTFTIETATSLTTDLRILKSLVSQITPANITQDLMNPSASMSLVATAARLFESWRARLLATLSLSAIANAGTEAARSLASLDDLPPAERATQTAPFADDWILVRKPLEGTVAENVAKWDTGGIAIDGCRVGDLGGTRGTDFAGTGLLGIGGKATITALNLGRWPANVTLDPDAAAMLDAQAGERPSTLTGIANPGMVHKNPSDAHPVGWLGTRRMGGGNVYADNGGPSRFFYVAKATTWERNFGCEHLPPRTSAERVDRDEGSDGMNSPRAGAGRTGGAQNHHPTIKSISLTKWLATLIKPPGDGKRLLCPFAGSGGEVIGGMRAGWSHVEGIEQDPDFVEIARARVKRWSEVSMHLEPDEVSPTERVDERQPSLFSKAGNE